MWWAISRFLYLISKKFNSYYWYATLKYKTKIKIIIKKMFKVKYLK